LSEIGLTTTYSAAIPTTPGVIETLGALNLEKQKVALQLYGEDPNQVLQDYLASRNAVVTCVAPYVYADKVEEEVVISFIHSLSEGEIDMVTFTSQPQLKRLMQVASKHGIVPVLNTGMKSTVIAAVGPVVRDQIQEAGFKVSIMPEKQYFMKPLVTAMVRFVEQDPARDNQGMDQ
jgi:uroporphyrinogen-III synthase